MVGPDPTIHLPLKLWILGSSTRMTEDGSAGLAIKLKSPGLPGLFRILLWLTGRRPASTTGQSPALFPPRPVYGERVGVRGKATDKTVYEDEFARCFCPSSRCRDLLPASGEKGNARTVRPKGGAEGWPLNSKAPVSRGSDCGRTRKPNSSSWSGLTRPSISP